MSATPAELKELIAKHVEVCASQEAEEERQLWLSQVERGKCNVVPFPTVATKPFRSERVVEQNSLFVANRYKGHCFIREWEVQHPSGSGEPVTKKLTVGEPDPKRGGYGVLKQVHQDVFYKLLQLWAEQNSELETNDPTNTEKIRGAFTISAYDLVCRIKGNDSASNYKRVQNLLQDLTAIPVSLESTYEWQGSIDKKHFTLLGDVYWDGKDLDKTTLRPKPGGFSKVTICFSKFVTDGFLKKRVKALLSSPYESLGTPGRGGSGELAKLLYPYLDGQLAKKDRFHIKLAALGAHFGLSSYRYKSKRKEKFSPAIAVLDKKPILGSRYHLRVVLRESSDGKDYVLEARREASNQLPLFED